MPARIGKYCVRVGFRHPIGFLELLSLNAESIANTILTRLKVIDVELTKMIDQDYDGVL